MKLAEAKIALVFDWMTNPGGAEKVNFVLHKLFPNAPIFTSIYNHEKLPKFENAAITTSFIQNLPFAKKKHQLYLSLMPQAYESFDLSSYDIVISSSHACAKGIITKPETLHICYCHTPMRYAWDNWHSYIREYKMNYIVKKLAKRMIHKIRIWDRLSADRVDQFIANSSTTQKRIEKYYGKKSDIIYPMIDMKKFTIAKKTGGYFLAVGRLIPYKKFELIIETFNQLGLPLKVAGTGPLLPELKRQARANIEFMGYVSSEKLKRLYSGCEALIFPQLEDFGITPLEAMASGRPVIAYKAGGALDTVVANKTGIFFNQQTPESLKKAIAKYQKTKDQFDPKEIRKHARKFSESEFTKTFLGYLEQKWNEWPLKK